MEAVRWHLTSSPRFAEFAPTPQPPDNVTWRPSADPYVWHLGNSASGPVEVRTETEVPHVAVVAGTGGGKTTLLTLPLLHSRQHGALVDVIDMKRMSFTERTEDHPYGIAGNPDRPSGVVTGVRIHTTIEAGVRALAEFVASATSVALMQQSGEDTSHIPDRVLVVDEFGSFASGVKQWWKGIAQQKGASLVPFWMHVALMQGRALKHRCVIGAHQLRLDLFGTSDARDLFGGRILVGDCSPEKWVTTYGRGIKRPAWDETIKGRGTYGPLGRRPTLMHAAYKPQAEANAELRAMPLAPEWFDDGDAAPWITEDYVREVQASYGAGRWVPGWEHLFDEDDDSATAMTTVDDDDIEREDFEDDSGDGGRLTMSQACQPSGPIPANYEQLRKAVHRSKTKGTFPKTLDNRLSADEWMAWWLSRPRAVANGG